MLVHVYNGGAYLHIGKIYTQAGITARFVSASFVTAKDLITADAIIVDSLVSLQALGDILETTKLYVGGKPTFKAMFGCSIKTKIKALSRPVRLIAGMTYKQLYTRQNKVLYFKILKKITHPANYALISKPNINTINSGINVLSYAEERAAKLGGKIIMIGLDVETKQEGIITGSVGDKGEGKSYWIYSMIEVAQATFAIRLPNNSYDLWTAVIPFKKQSQYDNIKEICGSEYPKTMSNGLYDMEQFLHWRIPVVNYAWDVEYYLRSVTSDLAGFYNLGNNSALWNLDIQTWKDLTRHNQDRNIQQYKAFLLYSGLDTHWTVATTINQMNSASGINLNNFLMRKQMDGLSTWMNLMLLPVDEEVNERLLEEATIQRIDNGKLFKKYTGLSHTQNKQIYPLMKTLHFNMRKLGYKEMGQLASLQEKQLSGLINSHPIWQRALEIFLDAKHGEKDGATFLQYIKYYQAKDLGREKPYFDYSMSQYTAKTMRYASSSSHAWCGGNVQNISGHYRQQYVIPEGEVAISIDAPQSEARTVGYLAQCITIIEVLEDPDLDYHIFNAANAVFKKPYETITALERGLSKAPGFGFFYGQTWYGLMMTLGVKAMRELREKMGLDSNVPLPNVARIISQGIDHLYFEIRKLYYPKVVEKYRTTSRVPCITGYSPLVIADINHSDTVRTIVCIDGQHTSAHINIEGGIRMLHGFLYGDTPIEKAMYPYLQLHDEIQARCKDTFTVKEVDDYTEELFENRYLVNGRVLSIPRGTPVFGRSLKDLKGDEIERTPAVGALTLKQILNHKEAH